MNGKRGGVSQVTQSGSYPGQAGALPAPAPSRTRPDSPHGNKAPRQAAHRSSPPANSALPEQSEKDFQAQVIALAQLCGWRVAHFRPARTKDGEWRTPVAADGAGFFDLVLMRERVIFCELKTNRGNLTREQYAWREAATRAGALAVVWRPRDWDLIEATLSRRGE